MTPSKRQTSMPKPCDFIPLDQSKVFPYLSKNKDTHCKDSDLAWFYASKWKNKQYKGELDAADLNNAACAYLWLKNPNWEQAYRLFGSASSESKGKNKVIEGNKRKAAKRVTKERPGVEAKKIRVPRDIQVPSGKPGLSIFKVRVPIERPKRKSRVGVPVGKSSQKIQRDITTHRRKRRK